MTTAERVFNRFLPSAEELWENAKAVMRPIQTGRDGHYALVPDFNPEIVDIDFNVSDEVIRRQGRPVGRTIGMHALTSDGIDREMHLHFGSGSLQDLFVKDGAAWTTKNGGYAGRRAEDIVHQTGMSVLQIGGEHSTNRHSLPIEFLQLGYTAVNALKISQSHTAQVEELLTARVVEEFGLPPVQAVIGDSKAKMKQVLHYPYAHEYGTEIIYSDGKAPCVPDKLELADVPGFVKWLGVEALGGSAVVARLALEGDLDMVLRTVALNPKFVLSSLIAARALASGEASLVDRMPVDAHGIAVIYDNDGMSRATRWDEIYAERPNYHVKHVPRGIHASLLQRKANSIQIDRLQRLAEEAAAHGIKAVDYAYVRTGRVQDELVAQTA